MATTGLKFSKTHEWVRVEADNTVTIGISEHAQKLLGDVVFVECPKMGALFQAGQETGVIESVKAASDLYAPMSGEVIEINSELAQNPELVNQQPYGSGWIYRIQASDLNELDALLDPSEYSARLALEEEA